MPIKIYQAPKPDEVHIWSACLLDTKLDINYFSSFLSIDEKKRANCFRFLRDQERFIISRSVLRNILAGYLGEAPQSIEIMYGFWGKPHLQKEKALHFNLSHSGDYVLYAITRDYEVGIDLEYINPDLELDEIALMILSPKELNYWKTVKPEEKVNVFFKLWVCKEALVKSSGKGWFNNEHAIALEKLKEFKTRKRNNKLERVTYPYYFEIFPNHASALFVEGPPLYPLHYNWAS